MPRRSWHSEPARLLKARFRVADAADAMVLAARALLAEAEIDAPPVDLPLVASCQGVREIQTVPMAHAGRLVPQGLGFLAQVNAAHTVGKRNFTTCHEVGHALLLEYANESRVIEDLTTGTYSGSEEEELCDIAAAELLLPMELFRPLAAEMGCSLATVLTLSRLFGASKEATARRLVDTHLWRCALAVWHWSYKPTERVRVGAPTLPGFEGVGPEPKLRIRYVVSSATFGSHLYPHLRAEADGQLMRCYENGTSVQGQELLKLDKEYQRFYVMAVPRDYESAGEPVRDVLSLMLAAEEPQELSFQADLGFDPRDWFD